MARIFYMANKIINHHFRDYDLDLTKTVRRYGRWTQTANRPDIIEN